MTQQIRYFLIIFNLLALVSPSLTSAKELTSSQIAKNRSIAMKEMAFGMKSLSAILRGREDFSTDKVKAALAVIEQRAIETPALFALNVTIPTSDAGSEIWQEFDDFIKKAGDLERVSHELSSSIETKEHLAEALKALGATCKSCHMKYRN